MKLYPFLICALLGTITPIAHGMDDKLARLDINLTRLTKVQLEACAEFLDTAQKLDEHPRPENEHLKIKAGIQAMIKILDAPRPRQPFYRDPAFYNEVVIPSIKFTMIWSSCCYLVYLAFPQ